MKHTPKTPGRFSSYAQRASSPAPVLSSTARRFQVLHDGPLSPGFGVHVERPVPRFTHMRAGYLQLNRVCPVKRVAPRTNESMAWVGDAHRGPSRSSDRPRGNRSLTMRKWSNAAVGVTLWLMPRWMVFTIGLRQQHGGECGAKRPR